MKDSTISCPIPHDEGGTVQLSHGSGGVMMHRLLDEIIFPSLGDSPVCAHHDGAVLPATGGRLAFTTDSYVVRPRFFPGGDIGSMAVHGTVNDLAMCGARPLCLSVGLILEEGLPLNELRRIMESLHTAATGAGIQVVTGDTKVVDRGKGDGIFINTSGIGIVEHSLEIGPAAIREGDAILLSGDIGRHGIAVLAARESLDFETTIQSDSALLHEPVLALLAAGLPVHCLRDLTRGGLAAALKELMLDSHLTARIREVDIPVETQVRGACEMLGLDPLHVANEGRMIAILPEESVEEAISVLSEFPVTQNALRIGTIAGEQKGRVVLESIVGTRRVVEMLHGEQLPRIC
ncbi:MAG: hydrogenase expression/formation protein HypE [Verrucomicrobiales bacterium]|nr:hydrogenase expression/formation protein HypE [Verrucomicrobiales bacterium]